MNTNTDTNPAAPASMATHTPTPWKIDENTELPVAVIEDNDDGIGIAELGERTPRNLANAAFITRACNSHAQLVAALSAIVAEVDAGKVEFKDFGFWSEFQDARAILAAAQS